MWQKKQPRQKSLSCVGGAACDYVNASWPRCPPCPGRSCCIQTNTGAWWPAGSGGHFLMQTCGEIGKQAAVPWRRRCGTTEKFHLQVTGRSRYAQSPRLGDAKHGGHTHSREDSSSVLPPSAPTVLAAGRTHSSSPSVAPSHQPRIPCQERDPRDSSGSFTASNPVWLLEPKQGTETSGNKEPGFIFVFFFFFFNTGLAQDICSPIQ